MTARQTTRALALLGIAALWAIGAGGNGAGTPATPSTPPAQSASPGAHAGHAMPASAANGKAATSERAEIKTITGEVMDPACFLEAGPKSIGPGHYQCAIDCARSGQTLAIYDRDADRIYFIAGELPGKNPNDPVINYIHQKVDVRGAVYHRSDAWGIVIQRVVPHKEKPSANAPAAKPAGH